jgi:hypothetical protein
LAIVVRVARKSHQRFEEFEIRAFKTGFGARRTGRATAARRLALGGTVLAELHFAFALENGAGFGFEFQGAKGFMIDETRPAASS